MPNTQIAIYGAGDFSREIAWLIESCNDVKNEYNFVCFMDDDKTVQGTELDGVPIINPINAYNQFSSLKIVGGVGNPKTRELMMQKAEQIGFEFATIIHPRTEFPKWIDIGLGTVICAGNILTVGVSVGQHVHINFDCTVGHDVILGDYTTLSPGVHVSGWVHFGRRVYVGTGAVFINGTKDNPIKIGDDAVIGAGACVTGSVPSDTTVVGVPAKPISN